MRMLAGVGSEVHFTHLSQACADSLLKSFSKTSKKIFPPVIADVFFTTKSVLGLTEAIGVSLDRVCLLDPKADRELSPDDTYTNFLFGVGVH
jgi:ribosome biogenesis SPOUT family RNA methylase Rps3